MSKPVNALILGQGLAGSLLSFELLSRGHQVLVLDDADPASASRIAAGLLSPISGQRSALFWRLEEIFPLASLCYQSLETLLGKRFYFPSSIRRYYLGDEHRRLLRDRAQEPKHAPWIGPEFSEGNHGGVYILGAAYLDVPGLLAAWRKHLQALGSFEETKVTVQDIFRKGRPEWQGQEFDFVVSCVGLRAAKEGPFDFLPFQATKGEILSLGAPESQLQEIAYAQHYAIPLGDGRFRVGSTYEREPQDLNPSPRQREAFLQSAEFLLQAPIEVLSHDAALRPNLLGHFPVLGRHPKIERLYVLNGLGSKGAAWAPYLARELTDHILDGKKLAKELDLARFKNLEAYPA